MECHYIHLETKTGTLAQTLIRCEPHKGDPSHRGYLMIPQQASWTHSLEYF